jgi:hypothetical protein
MSHTPRHFTVVARDHQDMSLPHGHASTSIHWEVTLWRH